MNELLCFICTVPMPFHQPAPPIRTESPIMLNGRSNSWGPASANGLLADGTPTGTAARSLPCVSPPHPTPHIHPPGTPPWGHAGRNTKQRRSKEINIVPESHLRTCDQTSMPPPSPPWDMYLFKCSERKGKRNVCSVSDCPMWLS